MNMNGAKDGRGAKPGVGAVSAGGARTPGVPAMAVGLILVAICASCCIAGNPDTGELLPGSGQPPVENMAGPTLAGDNAYASGMVPEMAIFRGAQGQSNLSEQVREYLDARFPRYRGTGYPLDIEVMDAPWLAANAPDASLVRAFAGITQPPGYEVFIARNDVLFAMPEAFNAFMADVTAAIATEDDALGVAGLYVMAWEPRGVPRSPPVLILSSAADIPQRVSPVPPSVSGEVAPPKVRLIDGDYSVQLTTWSSFDGTVRAWTVRVQRDGQVAADQRIVAPGVGDFRGGHE